MEEINEKAKAKSSLLITDEMDSILFSLYKLESKEEKVVQEILEKASKLIMDFKFESYNSKDEDNVYFINKFGPKVIETILELKSENKETKHIAISILEYFLSNFVSHNNFNNPELYPLWKALTEVFNWYNYIYEDSKEDEENNQYWVIKNI